MQKIPTIFERDWEGDKSRVLNKINPECQWVFDGEGIATRKIDGTCCCVIGGRLFKRREVKPGQADPENFRLVTVDAKSGKRMGWVPVDPVDRSDMRHREAFARQDTWENGTYELIGPKVQGNPENVPHHMLVMHGKGLAGSLYYATLQMRTFENLRTWFEGDIAMEGIVFHHPDGRMAKIKARDFGVKRRTR